MQQEALKPGIIYDAIIDYSYNGKAAREITSVVLLGQTDEDGRVCCLIDARKIASGAPELIPQLMKVDFITLINDGVPDDYRYAFSIFDQYDSTALEDGDTCLHSFEEAKLGEPCALKFEPIEEPDEPDFKELLMLSEPRVVPLRESLPDDATDADLFNSAHNPIHVEIESWDQIPDGYELLNPDDKAEFDRVFEEVYWLRQESEHLEGQKEIS